jgi:hypothetical protein
MGQLRLTYATCGNEGGLTADLREHLLPSDVRI